MLCAVSPGECFLRSSALLFAAPDLRREEFPHVLSSTFLRNAATVLLSDRGGRISGMGSRRISGGARPIIAERIAGSSARTGTNSGRVTTYNCRMIVM